MTRHRRGVSIVPLLLATAVGACRQVLTYDRELPDFPPTEFEPERTLPSGLILSATSEIVSEGPTTIRVTATVTNPTEEEILAKSLVPECLLIIAGFWEQRPDGRLLQPLDGYYFREGFRLDCEGAQQYYRIPAGDTLSLQRSQDLVVSAVLGDTFVPGRYILTAVFVDDFAYQVLAGDYIIDD